MSNQTSDYSVVNILTDFKNIIKDKNDAFALLLRLKQSLEFNATINWNDMYKAISVMYNDPNPYYQNPEYTLDPIPGEKMLDPNTIFVFGSNTNGRHDGGAANAAYKYYGAIYGQARGLQGQSYAIVTIDYDNPEKVTVKEIADEIDTFIKFAVDNEDKKFYVTKIGCGISGYSIKEIASLWKYKIIPPNVVLPPEFVSMVGYEDYLYSPSMNTHYHLKDEASTIVVKLNPGEECILNSYTLYTQLPKDVESSDKEAFTSASQQVLQKLY